MRYSRRQRALELVSRLENGPSFSLDPAWSEQARKLYQLWARSWIVDEVKDLIPELRDHAKVTADTGKE